MTIEHVRVDKSTGMLSLNGRLDTANAPMLERKIKQWDNDIKELILDFANLSYISSMGLRVLLQAKKAFKDEGRKLVIKNMGESIREVFEMTGFLHLMVQEEKFVAIRKNEADTVSLSLNGQLEAENVEAVAAELISIRDTQEIKKKPVTVILDMENLSFISPMACKLLKQAIDQSSWENRQLCTRNVSVDMQAALIENSLEDILSAS
ncbi:MAG: STAS domain-containing protein [Treponema sp.]|nr:STAS domain-containing protein [Treponema sp.]